VAPIPHSKPWIVPSDVQALDRVAASGWLIGGPAAADAAEAAAVAAGAGGAALFPSGRAALSAAVAALGLPPGSGIAVQTYACDAVAWAIAEAGCRPIPCDLQPDSWTCEPEAIDVVRGRGIAAVVLAPPFGLFQSARPFRKLGLPIVHDLCQADLTVLKDRWDDAGDLVAVSFHPTKYYGGAGGGAVLSRDAMEPAIRAAAERWSGFAPLSELAASLIVEQLARAEAIRARRAALAAIYRDALPEAWTTSFAAAVDVADGSLFRFVLRIDDLAFDALRDDCAADGVTVRRGVDALLAPLPEALRRLATTVSIPFYPALSADEAGQVAATVLRHAR
jgi:dTDP-4-amino-4,6-dideoxygalactose transaminase